MIVYPIRPDELIGWFRSREKDLERFGITLADISQSSTAKPAVTANFDSSGNIGQIVAWTSGEFDFQVVRVSDRKDVFFHQEVVSSLEEPYLHEAYAAFLRYMSTGAC